MTPRIRVPAVTTGAACMRWSPGAVQSWRRPEDGGFDARRYGVAELPEAEAKAFVTSRHYSRSYPAASLRYGLFDLAGDTPVLRGAAILSVPASRLVLSAVFPGLEPYAESLELGRLVLDDSVPANGESWFVSRAFRLAAARGIRGVVSFSDPLPRTRPDGALVKPGHVGIVYQALGSAYIGRSTPRTLAVMRDGTVFSARAMQKIRAQSKGHEYAERQLITAGARPMRPGQPPAAWLTQALDDARARPLRHKGNHRYAFRLGTTRRERAAVAVALPCQPYPKAPDGRHLPGRRDA
jgi:hypothetical protein